MDAVAPVGFGRQGLVFLHAGALARQQSGVVTATQLRRLLRRNPNGGLVSDAYVVYKSLTAKALQQALAVNDEHVWRPAFSMFVCWSHARRPFDRAAKSVARAYVVLDLIARLYAVEARARQQARGDPVQLRELTAELRTSESAVIIDKIDRWRVEQRAVPGTKMADGLTIFEQSMDGADCFFEQSPRGAG